jgi:hypothetical protein
MSESLPDYRVTARNTSVASENKIHDDATAKRYGFKGGLVPGVTVYAYMTHPIAEGWGTDWLDRGTADVRFVRPIFEGEDVTVTTQITERTDALITAEIRATTAENGECGIGTFTLPAAGPELPDLDLYVAHDLPDERPPATRVYFESDPVLGTVYLAYDESLVPGYLESIDDALPLYAPGGRVHPAYYLRQANRGLADNVKLGPWIHYASQVQHLGAAARGAILSTRPLLRSIYAKKGREYVEMDILTLADDQPVAHIIHTAIYQLPAGD